MIGAEGYAVGSTNRGGNVASTLYRNAFPREPLWIAVVGEALTFGLALGFGLPPAQFAALVLVPTPLLLVLLTARRIRLWPAQEAITWINLSASDRWRETLGGRMPANPSQARAWLERHPEGSAPPSTRAGMLLTAGRRDEAREVMSRMPSGSPHDLHLLRELELSLAIDEGRPVDTAAADDALRADTETSPAERELHLAYHAALLAVQRGDDGITPLTPALAGAGRIPPRYRRRILVWRFRAALLAAWLGIWLIAAMLVGMATSGGVVWF